MAPSPTERKVAVARTALARWRDNPAQFGRDLWGLEYWSGQRAMLDAVALHRRVTVRSGHKTGKSRGASILSLWWLLTRRDARVVVIAPVARQVTEVIWREICLLHATAKQPIGGRLYADACDGLELADKRQVIGISADTNPERVAGLSGNILYLLDEASGIPDPIHETISSNVAGRIAMFSNPTRISGAFYDSHHTRAAYWHSLRLSSEDAARENTKLPNGEYRWPYLANQEWVEDRRHEYGSGSPYYDVRVLGEFPRGSNSSVIGLDLVELAQKRWHQTEPEGQLEVGVDPARFGGDDTAIIWRRGRWAAEPIFLNGSDTVQVVGKVLELLSHVSRVGEKPIVRVDATSVGGGVADTMKRHEGIEVVGIDASFDARSNRYARARDEMWFSMRDWLRDGGCLPPSKRLSRDLIAPMYDYDERGRLKVESKRSIRGRLGRSTDAADALALAVYDIRGEEPSTWDPVCADIRGR